MKRISILLVLAAAAVLYGWLAGARWITPDEGAHLMDGRRILLDHVPVADYGARMPLYCYVLAASQALFGGTLLAGRIVPLLATLLAGALIYRIAGRAAGAAAGVLGAILFLFSPLTIHYATVVQTQPLVIAFSLLAAAAAIRGGARGFLAAGALLGCAFYVRESALAALLAFALYSFLYGGRRGFLGGTLPLAGGFAAVALLALAAYLPHMSAAEWWASRLNPLALPVEAARALLSRAGGALVPPAYAAGMAALRSHHLRPPSLEYLEVGFRFLLLPILAGAATALRGVPAEGEGNGRELRTVRLARLWLLCLSLFYLYWYLFRGFYPGYFREFEPALVLLAAIGLTNAFRRVAPPAASVVFAAASVTGAILIQSGFFPFWAEDYSLALAAAAGFLVLTLAGEKRGRRLALAAALAAAAVLLVFLLRRPPEGPLRIGAGAGLLAGFLLLALAASGLRVLRARRAGARLLLAVALFALVYSTLYARNRGGLRFHAEWSPETVDRVGRLVAESSTWGETVLSGAVIWEYVADRRPVHGINHPLGLKSQDVYTERHLELLEIFRRKPPRVVVMDGQTEDTYFRAPGMEALVRSAYEEVLRIDGSAPVEVWVLPPDATPPLLLASPAVPAGAAGEDPESAERTKKANPL